MAWFTSRHLPVHRDQLRAQRSVTSMGKLYLFIGTYRHARGHAAVDILNVINKEQNMAVRPLATINVTTCWYCEERWSEPVRVRCTSRDRGRRCRTAGASRPSSWGWRCGPCACSCPSQAPACRRQHCTDNARECVRHSNMMNRGWKCRTRAHERPCFICFVVWPAASLKDDF